MDSFSYMVVLTSIILGLGVTRLVGGLGHLMQTRRRKRPYWVHTFHLAASLTDDSLSDFVASFSRSRRSTDQRLGSLFLPKPTRHFSALRSNFSNRHHRYAFKRDGALPSPRPALRDDNGALVRSVPYRRIYQTQTLPRVFCRDLSDLQSGIRWHYVANRSRRHRRNTTIESRFVHNPTGCLASNPRGGR